MTEKYFSLFMRSVDDELLEEAARPSRRTVRLAPYLAAAACFVLVLGAVALRPQPKSAEPAAAPETAVANPVHQSGEAELAALGLAFPLPAAAEDVQYSVIETGTETIGQTRFTLNGKSYTGRALKSDSSRDISGVYAQWSKDVSWQVGGVALELRDSESEGSNLSWYDAQSAVQYSLSADAAEKELMDTALEILQAFGYNVAVAPAEAADIAYRAFSLDGLSVAESSFTLGGVRYAFCMAATLDVSADFADISGADWEGSVQGEGSVLYCPARLSYSPGGQGRIVWFDVVPGLLYSLSMDTAADEAALLQMAETVFTPAQGDVG